MTAPGTYQRFTRRNTSFRKRGSVDARGIAAKPCEIGALGDPGRFFIASHGKRVGVQHFST